MSRALPTLTLLLLASSVSAQTTTGNVALVPAPASVVENANESSDVQLFLERGGTTLASPIDVDFNLPGTHVGDNEAGPVVVPAGTIVRSYFLYLDPLGSNSTEGDVSATFANPIVGVIANSARIDASDAALGHATTTYPTPGSETLRGLEDTSGFWPDTFVLSPDLLTLELDTIRAATAVDSLRILVAEPGVHFCACDGSGTPAPCGNSGAPGAGCANGSAPEGCRLSASGIPAVGADTLSLSTTSSSSGQPGLFFQGDDALGGGFGFPFGDGLRCVGTNVVRLQTVAADASGVAATSVAIAAVGGVAAGDVKRYQWWYRDPAGTPCGAAFNLSNGVEVVWAP